MRRTFLAAAAAVILFPMLAASSSAATVPKIDVSHAQAMCDVSGTVSFNPPLTTHMVSTKVKVSATLTTCVATGTPSPVTLSKGSLRATLDATDLSCSQLFNFPQSMHGSFTITWKADHHTPIQQTKTVATSVSTGGQIISNATLSRTHTQVTLTPNAPTGAFLGASGTGANVHTRMILQPSSNAIGNLCFGAGVKSLAVGLGEQSAG